MNNSTANFTSATVSADLIHEIYVIYVRTLFDFSVLALLSYTTTLAIPQEMEYMWSRKYISITSVLYAFTRYGTLIIQAINLWLDFPPSPGSLCNILTDVQEAVYDLTYIGVQGLLISRAYSLCQGNKIIAGALVFIFLAGLIFNIYRKVSEQWEHDNLLNDHLVNFVDPGCPSNVTSADYTQILATDICVCLADLLAFCVCIWKVWGTWKLKRQTGIRGYNDLVSVLIRQTVSRFGFVITFTITGTILTETFAPILTLSPIFFFLQLQHSFSAMLLADFALDLRRQNSPAIRSANIALPTIQITSVMSYIHQSILVEMGDHEDDQAREGDGDDDPPADPGSQDVDLQSEST